MPIILGETQEEIDDTIERSIKQQAALYPKYQELDKKKQWLIDRRRNILSEFDIQNKKHKKILDDYGISNMETVYDLEMRLELAKNNSVLLELWQELDDINVKLYSVKVEYKELANCLDNIVSTTVEKVRGLKH